MTALQNLRVAAAIILSVAVVGVSEAAEKVVIDLAEHDVSIDLRFDGTNLLVFGIVAEGDDVIVVARGPNRVETVHRKENFGGIWANGTSRTFGDVPSFYAIAASRPIAQILSDRHTLISNEIGIQNMVLTSIDSHDAEINIDEFRNALLTEKIRKGLFTEKPLPISVNAGRLFRTTVHLPSTVSTGSYEVSVFDIKNGQVIGSRTTRLSVQKVGIEARIFELSRKQAPLYGIAAVLMALLAGWSVAFIFRRG
jgi:uncharacterized protein (TIGR02186 family)